MPSQLYHRYGLSGLREFLQATFVAAWRVGSSRAPEPQNLS
jgi:hypothetical protein